MLLGLHKSIYLKIYIYLCSEWDFHAIVQPDCLFQRIAFLRLSSMVVTAETQPAAKSANTRKRAHIFAKERELKICAFQNSRVSAKTL